MRPSFGRMGRGRPPGRQHDLTVHVRMPSYVLRAVQKAAATLKVTVSEVIRQGVQMRLVSIVAPLVQIAKDPKAPARKRLKAMDTLMAITAAGDSLGPRGLELARAKASRERRERAARASARAAARDPISHEEEILQIVRDVQAVRGILESTGKAG